MKHMTPTNTPNITNPTNPNEQQTKSNLKQIIQEKLSQQISPSNASNHLNPRNTRFVFYVTKLPKTPPAVQLSTQYKTSIHHITLKPTRVSDSTIKPFQTLQTIQTLSIYS